MREAKSCIHPFIQRIQYSFNKGASLDQAFGEVEIYQKRVANIYNVDTYWIHAVAVSNFGLGSIVLYEYLRHKGMPFPSLVNFLNVTLPTKLFSERIIFKEKWDSRHEAIEDAFKESQ